MVRNCEKCGFVNQDDYDYCAKCGNPLVEGLRPKQLYVYRAQEPPINKTAIIISYIVTIILSWSAFFVYLFTKSTKMIVFTFFGLFLPFYLIQAPTRSLRKHGILMFLISLVGVALSFYVMFH